MVFIDGLNTIFAFGGIYAAGTFGMDFATVILFGIALNVTAGLGALAGAWIDDWLGAKRTLVISIAGLLVAGAGAVLAPSEPWFWAAGLLLGVFVGPTQSASRSMMARLAPPERRSPRPSAAPRCSACSRFRAGSRRSPARRSWAG